MLKQRYMLVIADATGRPLRRFKVTPRRVSSTLMGLGSALLVVLVVIAHLWTLREDVSVAQHVRGENTHLAQLTQRLESRLPAIQKLARTTESTFDQVWSKSALGRDPTLLPEHMPLERDDEPIVPTDRASSASAPASDNKQAARNPGPDRSAELSASVHDFAELPASLDKLEHHILRLQGTLGETLEYYHDAAQLLASTPSIRPTRSPWLSSSFGKRIDPIYGYWVMHKGLDMPGHIGMEVMAPADGVVIWTGWRGGYGQTVVIDHGYGLQTHFAHLSAYLVESGMHVRRGDLVARMGSTGKSTGPHLHYEVRRLGQPMDPRRFILD